MANGDADLELTVGASADKNSAKKAAKEIQKEVDNSTKGGRIDVTIPVKVDKKQIAKAQDEIVKEVTKRSSKGFSASKKQKFSQGAIDKAIQNWLQESQEREIRKRRFQGIKSIGPRGFKRNTGVNGGVATSKTAMDTERGGPYPSNWARQMRISELAAVKWMKKSLKIYQNNDLANQFSNNAIRSGGNKNKITKQQEMADKANMTSNQLAKILGGLESNNPKATLDNFNKYLNATLTFNESSGKNVLDGILLTLNKTFNRYFNTSGSIGLGMDDAKGVGPGHANAQIAIAGMIKAFKDALDKSVLKSLDNTATAVQKVSAEQLRQIKQLAKIDPRAAEKEINKILNMNTISSAKKTSNSGNQLEREINNLNKKVENQTNLDKIEHSAERVADSKQEELSTSIQDIGQVDADDGMNSESNTNTLFAKIDKIDKIQKNPYDSILATISDNLKVITQLIAGSNIWENDISASTVVEDVQATVKPIEKINKEVQSDKKSHEVPSSGVITSTAGNKIWSSIKNTFRKVFNPPEVNRVMSMNQADQEKRQAEITRKYGLDSDIASIYRRKSLWGRTGANPFADLKLTPGIGVDSSGITSGLQKLVQKNMFGAQTGGFFKNVVGSMFGYIGVPSLEKSRTQVEGLNTIIEKIRQAALSVLQEIETKETKLSGLEKQGLVRFENGQLVEDKTGGAATTLFAQMEEQKESLRGILAEASMVDSVAESTHGNVAKIIKQLGFAAPELRECNVILQNLNAGLDKSGKVLKHSTRTGEILNYSFQLMARNVGQMWKNWMMMLNPINLIKRAFSMFSGYSTKWQRTMNVVKYNLHAILEPFMDKVAQFLVNCLGIIDTISQRVQKVFGVLEPVSLFDQSAANAQKMKEELEAAANVTAGFDELHDIGSNNSGANDLMGEIYKPELSPEWQTFADKVGGIFEKIASTIKWCIDNWKLLASLLAGFVIGKGLWDLFKNFFGLGDAIKGLPGIFSNALTAMGFVGGVLLLTVAFKGVWDLGKNWNQMTEEERNQQRRKNNTFGGAGGTLLGATAGFKAGGLAGGLAGGAIGWGVGYGATNLAHTFEAAYNGDKASVKKSAEKAGIGIGEAIGAGIGTAIGGPIGTIVGGGIGAIVGDITGRIGGDVANWFLYNGAYANLKISQEDLKWAIEQTDIAEQNQLETLKNLKDAEEKAGIKGEDLYNSVKNGVVSIDDMTTAQLNVYDAYLKHQKAIKDTHTMQQQQMDFETSMDLDRAKKTGNYEGYIQKMMQANKDGIYSEEEVRDRLSQVYAKLDNESRKTFMENIPEYMRNGIEEGSKEYESDWRKFSDKAKQWFKELFEPLKEAGSWFWDGITSVGNLITGQGLQSNREKEAKKQKEKEAELNYEVYRYRNKVLGPDPTITEEEKDRLAEEYEKKLKSSMASYAIGTNYVPNDGLAYLHQGEAVIPKKYNQPYQPTDTSNLENAINTLTARVTEIGNQVNQGIPVTGEFKQRGSDLVAVVQRGQNRNGNQPLSNPAYAR